MSIRDYAIRCTTPEEYLKAKKALHKMGEPVYQVNCSYFIEFKRVAWIKYNQGTQSWYGWSYLPTGKEEILAQEFIDE